MGSVFKAPKVPAPKPAPPPAAPVDVAVVDTAKGAGIRTDIAGKTISDTVSNSTIVPRAVRTSLQLPPLK